MDRRLTTSLLGSFVIALASGCSSQPTYHADIAPLIEEKCSMCHVEGGIAPFSLGSYDDVTSRRSMIREQVTTRHMPPWPPARDCNDYKGDRSLTDAQLHTFTTWLDGGMPEGRPTTTKALTTMRGLSRVDAQVAMTGEYTPMLSPDDYRCFVLDWPETTTKYITGFRASPGNATIVHHVIAFIAGPNQAASLASKSGPEGYKCFGGPNANITGILGTWTPGDAGGDFPDTTGIQIDPGSKIILQVHYNTLAAGASPDLTTLDIKLDDSVEHQAGVLPWANPAWLKSGGMKIPAGDPDVVQDFSFAPDSFFGQLGHGLGLPLKSGSPITIYAAQLHMHLRGTSGRLEINPTSGPIECMLDIPAWDFHWQGAYQFEKPKVLNPGDSLNIECHFNNSDANQPIVDGKPLPTTDVWWGEGTTDEMCLGGLYITQ
jgi:hypothetical protein